MRPETNGSEPFPSLDLVYPVDPKQQINPIYLVTIFLLTSTHLLILSMIHLHHKCDCYFTLSHDHFKCSSCDKFVLNLFCYICESVYRRIIPCVHIIWLGWILMEESRRNFIHMMSGNIFLKNIYISVYALTPPPNSSMNKLVSNFWTPDVKPRVKVID